MDQKLCWRIIEEARSSTLSWASAQGFPLYRIEYVATFEHWANGIEVYVFFSTDHEKESAQAQGHTAEINRYYLETLSRLEYPFDRFPEVRFFFDSDENVKRNYAGSYFFRLR